MAYSTTTISIFQQVLAVFCLITLVQNIVKRTRFEWVLKGSSIVMILLGAIIVCLGLRDGVIVTTLSDLDALELLGSCCIAGFLAISIYSFYDFKLTLFLATPALATVLHVKQTAAETVREHYVGAMVATRQESIMLWTLWGVALGLFATVSNYITQKNVTELIIDKQTVVRH